MSRTEKDVPDPANGAWHLDKRIPIALIFSLIVQTATIVWWASNISSRLDRAVEVNSIQDNRLERAEAGLSAQAVSNATLTAQLTAVRESLLEVKNAQAETLRILRDQVKN